MRIIIMIHGEHDNDDRDDDEDEDDSSLGRRLTANVVRFHVPRGQRTAEPEKCTPGTIGNGLPYHYNGNGNDNNHYNFNGTYNNNNNNNYNHYYNRNNRRWRRPGTKRTRTS